MVRVRPGFGGRDGETEVETRFPTQPEYTNRSKYYKAPGFSNNQPVNLVKVTVKKQEQMLQVFINDSKLAEYEKAIPSAHPFTVLSFAGGSSAENGQYYVSHVKITKD